MSDNLNQEEKLSDLERDDLLDIIYCDEAITIDVRCE